MWTVVCFPEQASQVLSLVLRRWSKLPVSSMRWTG
jgi:hypothetical protein